MTFRPGDQIKVTLSGRPFKGFLLEARDAEDVSGPPVGSFTWNGSQEIQLLNCKDVEFNASGCGNKKFCIRSPLNCDPEQEHACVFLSFTRDGHSVMVEMSGPSNGYLSFAFSHDRWMGDDDDAYLCIHEDQTVVIQPSHLTGRSPPVMDPRGPLEDMAWRLADGIMQCSFRRNITLPGVKNRFDLNTSYYIFLADGAANDGALMFVAWMTTVSTGVLIARFFRSVWSKAFFLGEAAWFQRPSLTCLLVGGDAGRIFTHCIEKRWVKGGKRAGERNGGWTLLSKQQSVLWVKYSECTGVKSTCFLLEWNEKPEVFFSGCTFPSDGKAVSLQASKSQ
ncbi:Ferric-chelate reductase 1 [Tupaia chinensis]|uniref:Ferric-chelate reductase 1 n=1 Tax=Tupaia chinensis TaxID=246437 RepID=L8Y847_TUPCH|nr:Ferric-chelate reductase 1 [Tupaia chinensis]